MKSWISSVTSTRVSNAAELVGSRASVEPVVPAWKAHVKLPERDHWQEQKRQFRKDIS